MLTVSWFLCGVLYTFLYCYLFSKFVCETPFLITKKIIMLSIIFSFFYCLILKINSGVLQPYLTHIIMFFILIMMYKKSITKTLMGELSIFIILFVIELIYGYIFLLLFGKSASSEMSNWIVYLFSNYLIFIFGLFLSKINILKNLISITLKWYKENEFRRLIALVILAMAIGIFALYNNFNKLLPASILLLANLFCLGIFVFVIGFFYEKSNNNKIAKEYDNLLNYVKIYEEEIDEKSKNQHEYRNQLIVIKNLINSRNRKAMEYIDKQINEEVKVEDRSWLGKLKYVPEGGLKGLIYYKIQEMLKDILQFL